MYLYLKFSSSTTFHEKLPKRGKSMSAYKIFGVHKQKIYKTEKSYFNTS